MFANTIPADLMQSDPWLLLFIAALACVGAFLTRRKRG